MNGNVSSVYVFNFKIFQIDKCAGDGKFQPLRPKPPYQNRNPLTQYF